MKESVPWAKPHQRGHITKLSVRLGERRLHAVDRIENGEERWQTFGMVRGVLLVMVAHTVREEEQAETVIRIISARRADRKEKAVL